MSTKKNSAVPVRRTIENSPRAKLHTIGRDGICVRCKKNLNGKEIVSARGAAVWAPGQVTEWTPKEFEVDASPAPKECKTK